MYMYIYIYMYKYTCVCTHTHTYIYSVIKGMFQWGTRIVERFRVEFRD
jgi:hypothetical protein